MLVAFTSQPALHKVHEQGSCAFFSFYRPQMGARIKNGLGGLLPTTATGLAYFWAWDQKPRTARCRMRDRRAQQNKRKGTAIFDGPAAQTHHAHRKRRAICKAWPCARAKIDTFNRNPAEHLV